MESRTGSGHGGGGLFLHELHLTSSKIQPSCGQSQICLMHGGPRLWQRPPPSICGGGSGVAVVEATVVLALLRPHGLWIVGAAVMCWMDEVI